MLVQVKMNREKNYVKSTPSAFISVIFALLAAGCTSLPNREIPHELGVKQVPGMAEGHPAEYVFCDMKGGAWGCEEATPKTPIKYVAVDHGDTTPITDAIKGAIKGAASAATEAAAEAVTGTASNTQPALTPGANEEQAKASEKAVPNVPPIAVVYFDFDSSIIKADAKLTLLDALVDLEGKSVELHGYTDNVGSETYNNWLGLRRANKVKEFFKMANSTATQIEAYGHGLCCYAAPNGTDEQRAKNRRVEIYVTD